MTDRDTACTRYKLWNWQTDPTRPKMQVESKGSIVFDESVGRYILTDIFDPLLMYPMLFEHCFDTLATALVSHEKKVILWVVSRNGCSTSYATFLKYAGGEDIKDNSLLQPAKIWSDKGHSLSVCIDLPAYKKDPTRYIGYTNVCVFQDPVTRIVNLCNYWMNYPQYLTVMCPEDDEIKKAITEDPCLAMTHLLNMAKVNLFNIPEKQEQHMASQMKHLELFPVDMDMIVPLEKLDDFFRSYLHWEPVQANREVAWKCKRDMLTYDLLDRIEEQYQEDFLIPELFKDKFYDNTPRT